VEPTPGAPSAGGYDIYQAPSPGGQTGPPVNTHGTSYLVTGLMDGTAYYFTVTAVYGTGQQGPPSGQAQATPKRLPQRWHSPPLGWLSGVAFHRLRGPCSRW
jgi:hypothetical protein